MNLTKNFDHYIFTIMAMAGLLSACDSCFDNQLEVTATAYTLREAETKKGHIGLAAWGDQLEPGMQAIAVSRDLIKQGLGHQAKVKIDGFEGYFTVRDKMNKRWRKRIDIFMGHDLKKARNWGKQKVVIRWNDPKND